MDEKKPKISVLMSCYNHERYVAVAIESVLAQTYQDFELIVVDNGCTDDSYEVIKKYEDKLKSIRLEKNDIVLSGKILLEAARGEYVAFMTSDDYWMPDKLEQQVMVLEKCKDVAVCTTWAYTADENLKYDELQHNHFMVPNYGRTALLKHFLEKGNCIAYPSAVIRREFLLKKKKPERGYRQLDDLFLWIHILLDQDIYIVEKPLMIFRWHTSGNNMNMSAPSYQNLMRHWNERADIIGYVLDVLSDELFVQVFADCLIDKKPKTTIQVLCEKFLWLKNKAQDEPLLEPQLISFYFNHSSYEFQNELETHYGFKLEDFWEISGSKGFPIAYTYQKAVQNENVCMYRKGIQDAIEKIYSKGSREYKTIIISFLPEDAQEQIRGVCELIDKLLHIVSDKEILKDSAVYYSIIDALEQIIVFVEGLRDELLFLGINLNENDWQMYKELVEYGKNDIIDFYECVFPYTELIYNKLMDFFE